MRWAGDATSHGQHIGKHRLGGTPVSGAQASAGGGMLAADELTPPCSEPQTRLRALLNLPLIAEPRVGLWM